MTTITIVGNLTDDPELRFTPTGQAVAKFTVAVNDRVRQADGTYTDATPVFWPCTVWRDLAEHVAESLSKGHRVIATGHVRGEQWEDKATGEKRSRTTVTVTAIGPELTWATASPRKMARGNGAPGDEEWATASRTRPTSDAPVGA